jgi:hypothetical protein
MANAAKAHPAAAMGPVMNVSVEIMVTERMKLGRRGGTKM